MKNLITVFYFALFFQSCISPSRGPDSREITVTNKSSGTIYCFRSPYSSFQDPYCSYSDSAIYKYYRIEKNNSIILIDNPEDWGDYTQGSVENKIRFFIITQDTIDKYGWDSVFSKNKFTVVYKLDVDDLDSIGWEIVYDRK